MGGLKASSNSSLEQLKALDSISGLEDQLDEAKRLCTHRVRADMILKWLLEKLKKNPMARINSEAWKTLTATLRLLSPERIGVLLPSSTLFRTLQIALSGSSNVADRLATLADLLTLLIETSHAPDGVPVRAILSLAAKDAAVFLGVWSKAVHNYYEDGVPSLSEWQRYIQLGFQIWAFRKHSVEEDEYFADECLLPVTRLLSTASSDPRLFTDVSEAERLSRKKRRQGLHVDYKHPDIELPQLHLARHIFIPARKVFFQKQGQAQPKELSRYQHPAQSSDTSLERMLGTMRLLVQSIRTDDSSGLVDYFPRLLDVALRSISLENPKQKSAENSWIFALWNCLYEILCRIPAEAAKNSISEMLSVVEGRSIALSQEVLRDVVERFGGLREDEVDWSIITQIIALDPGVFVNIQVAEPLFAAVTASTVHDEEVLVTDPSSSRRKPYWIYPVVVPVMQAFAKAQNLHLFIQLWEQQLMEDRHEKQMSVWMDLDDSFAPLIEDYLADEQILQLFARQYNKFGTEESGSMPQSKLNASIVVLNALLGGIKKDSILLQIMSELLRIFMNAPSTTPQATSPFQEWRFWSLATKAFALWFPLWAAKQSDTKIVIAWAHDALASPVVAAALAMMQPERRAQELEQTKVLLDGHFKGSYARQDASDPAYFIATVCYHLYHYPSLRDACNDKMNELLKIMDVCDLPALLCYPAFLTTVNSEALRSLLQKCIKEEGGQPQSNASTLLALVSSEVSHGKSQLIEPLLEASLPVFGPENQSSGHVTRNYVVVSLMGIPPTSFSRAQRERVLNALTVSTWDSASQSAEIGNQPRLALMIRLMQTANPTCDLSTDATALRRIADQIINDGNSSGRVDDFESHNTTVVLLKELVRRVFTHLIATQDQQRSHDVLLSFSEQLVKDIGKPSKLKWSSMGSSLFNLSMVMLSELEGGCKSALKDNLPHHGPKFAKKLIKALLEKYNEILLRMSRTEDRDVSVDDQAFPSICDALLDLPIPYFDLSGLQHEDVVEPAAAFLQSMLASEHHARLRLTGAEESFVDSMTRITRLTLVRSLCIVSKFSFPHNDLAVLVLAEDLLLLDLDPLEHDRVRRAFEQGVEHLTHDSLVVLTRRMLADEGDLTRAGLDLLPVCIKSLEKEAVESNPESILGNILQILLGNALRTSDIVILTRAMQCMDTILREKPFLANQHAIETILINLSKLARNDQTPATAYELGMRVFTTLFFSHRSRLQGRYHLVVRALQQLLSQLFTSTDFPSAPASSSPKPGHPLTATHSTAFARLLTLLCEPPQRQPSTSADGLALVDIARREQAHAGQHVPVLLHQFCVQMLHGKLAGDGMREALNPGLWAVIEAMEMHEAHGVRVLSASMNENERAVLRGVYEEWRRFGKWRGG